MKAIDLFKFVDDNALEYHWHFNNVGTSDHEYDVILFVDACIIGDFIKLLKSPRLSDDGFLCRMKNKYFCFWMADICEYFNIDLDEAFPNEVIEGSND
jgi:hypothetical protein